ncbi:PREDICTED: carboxy-terminal domain RNA polymerase II polypeptide A small phosphatase 1-like [Camelina sativa]|uniref:Carboxy-terminal domain RNA polymerase II polypeptide A small phosphatase 1-like n=1 Tax=Camelina sativa TaxID=90675 RepID=A0ABM0WZC9_CAMSA|nr:PREDICTED: carboxy-terminal domain RNA polymerase II polypeptide A small phosphatase 1-like [Camelina sativa]
MTCHGFLMKPKPKSFGRHKHGRRNHHHQHHQSRCSAAAVAAAGSIFRSLNTSIFTFHNRLLRCVSRFFRLATTSSATPSHRATVKQGYKKLQKPEYQPHLRKRNDKKRTVVLDLDETLVHSTMEPPTRVNADFMVRIKMEGEVIPMFVVKRPGVTEFLERISKNYRVAIFTAGLPEYASQILDKLDKNRVISQRLYRDSCTEMNGRYAKDLSLVIKTDLGSVLLVDDNPFSYSLQPDNGVPIIPFVDDMEDQELMKLAEFFDRCYQYEDLRDAATEFLSKKLI